MKLNSATVTLCILLSGFVCKCCVLDVPGTPSLLQLEADDGAVVAAGDGGGDDDDDVVTLTCRASAINSKPSQLAPRLQYQWIVDDQPLNETDLSNVSSISVARDSGLSYSCRTRELGSHLQSLPSNRLLMLPRLRRSTSDTCKSSGHAY